MSIEVLAEQLSKQGKKTEIRNGKLFVNGRHVPVVAQDEQPYMSDCPNGVCNIG